MGEKRGTSPSPRMEGFWEKVVPSMPSDKGKGERGYPRGEFMWLGVSGEQLSVSCVSFFPNKVPGFARFKVISKYLRIYLGKLYRSLPREGSLNGQLVAQASIHHFPLQGAFTSSPQGYSLRKRQGTR